eukprot:15324668-Heterocapsa_arctica.AAC.1
MFAWIAPPMIDSGCVTECAVGGASSQPQPVGKGGCPAWAEPRSARQASWRAARVGIEPAP